MSLSDLALTALAVMVVTGGIAWWSARSFDKEFTKPAEPVSRAKNG